MNGCKRENFKDKNMKTRDFEKKRKGKTISIKSESRKKMRHQLDRGKTIKNEKIKKKRKESLEIDELKN